MRVRALEMNWVLLQNSLLVSAGTTLCALGGGFAAALCLRTLDPRWRHRGVLLAVMALVLPPFLATNCWLDLLGQTGAWRGWLPLNIYSLGGTIWILTLLLWPISTLFILSAWDRLEQALLEADPALSGRWLLRFLLWPMARGPIALAALVTFVLALNNFAVPAILQVKVFPAELWVSFNTHLDASEALLVSWPLVVAPLLLLMLWRRKHVRWPFKTGAASGRQLRRQLGPTWAAAAGLFTLLLLTFSLGLPLAQVLAQARTWIELPKVAQATLGPAWNSIAFAAGAACLCFVSSALTIRWPLGQWLWFPFLVPGVFLGIALIYLFNRPGLDFVYHSAAIILFAWTVRYAALSWHGLAHARQGVDREITDAARLDGASGWALARHILWPQIAPQVAAAWYLTYLLCLWDVETLVLIYPPGGETLALRIFNLLHYGHTAQVNALCVLLLGIAAAPWLLVRLWQTADLWVNGKSAGTRFISQP